MFIKMSRLRRVRNELFTTGIYKSRDSIVNFRIKVKLERNKSQKCGNGQSEQPELVLQPILLKNGTEIDEKTFSWQEKVFSLREIQKYSDISNCCTTLEKKYHKDVAKITKKRLPRSRIFTYTAADKYTNLNEGKENILISGNNNYLTDNIKNLHLKKESIYAQSMTIMADVAESHDAGSTSDEVVLCIITFSADGALTVTPDFNDLREPYQFEIENDEKRIFRYVLQHASDAISKEEEENEKKMVQELYFHRLEIMKKAIGDEFEMPVANTLKVFLFCEIVSARDFGWQNLYVNYILDLPLHWSASNADQQLSGSTLTASTTANGRDDVAHFSYPFSIELNLDTQLLKTECLKLPQLLIQVWSKDYWNRYRIEGYGHADVPSKPGIYNFNVETWQPISNSIGGQLRNFFLGSHPELDDLAFPATSKVKCHPLNRVGIRTQSSGSVDIKIQIIQQSLDFIESDVTGVTLKTLASGLGSLSIRSSVTTVLEAFQRARRRMLKARESLLSTTTTTSSSLLETSTCKSTIDSTCDGSSESSSGVVQTVQAIIHKSQASSSDFSQDRTDGMFSEEILTTSSMETSNCNTEDSFSSVSVNRARMRRREKKLKLSPLSS